MTNSANTTDPQFRPKPGVNGQAIHQDNKPVNINDRLHSKPRFGGNTVAPENRKINQDHKDKKEPDKEEEDDDEEEPTFKEYALGLVRDIVIAVIIMVIIIGSLWWYTDNWPPMVVVESNSMMHGSDSSIDVIDTGDLVLVKNIHNNKNEIVTYVEGEKTNYKTYGSYGDVIIFKKNGLDDTPVIHRAVVWIIYNASGHNNFQDLQDLGSFDVPSKDLWDVTEIYIENYQPNNFNLTIPFKPILENFRANPNAIPKDGEGGFITKGDNNDLVDQTSLTDFNGRKVEPIKAEWIVGKAEGELPWFGLIKLYLGGDTASEYSKPPKTSVNMLFLSIFLIVVIPIALDVTFSYVSKKKKKAEKEKKEEAGQDTRISSGGPGLPQARKGYGPPPGQRIGLGSQGSRGPQSSRTDPSAGAGRTREDLLKKIK